MIYQYGRTEISEEKPVLTPVRLEHTWAGLGSNSSLHGEKLLATNRLSHGTVTCVKYSSSSTCELKPRIRFTYSVGFDHAVTLA